MMMTKKKKKKKKNVFILCVAASRMVCAVDVGVQANGGFEREWKERRTDAVNFQEKVFF
jgi:hypothetical protein